MEKEQKKEPVPVPVVTANSGMATRMQAHNAVLRNTGDRKAAIRAYCQSNVWFTENAKAVENW